MAQNLAPILSKYGITQSQMFNAINAIGGNGVSVPRYRLLDQNLNPINTGGRSNVADPADFSDFVLSCTTTSDITRPVVGDATITLRETVPDTGASVTINPLTHTIQLLWQYWSGGKILFEMPVGIYGFIIPDRNISDSGGVWSVQCNDLSYQLNQLPFLNSWAVAANTNVVTAITAMLTCGAIPKSQGGTGVTPAGLDFAGPALPTSRINISPTTLVTPATVVYTNADTVLSAANALLDSINYQPLWVDGNGVFQSAPKPNYSVSVPDPAYTYATGPTSTIAQPVTWRITDQSNLANIVKVLSANATANATFSSVAYNNNNTTSALCLSVLGRPMVRVIQDDTIPDQASCDLRAHVELQAAAVLAEQVQFSAWVNPILQPHDVISFTYSINGVAEIANSLGWEITGYGIDCGAKSMSLQIGRVIAL